MNPIKPEADVENQRSEASSSPAPSAQAPSAEAPSVQEATSTPVGSPTGQDTRTHEPGALAKDGGDDLPPTLGGYRVLRRIGQGGMGVVYEAMDVKLERRVALKVMKPQIADDPPTRERFLREARVAAKVESDFICPIYQVGEENGVPFIAMPFLKGESLDARLKRGAGLPLESVVRIGREVAEGLSAAHEAGLIHRDIKPANIWLESMRSGPPRARLLDFGLARLQTDDVHITQTGAIVGTPAYMSPEQADGKEVDARTDLFSLGCVLYAACTGELPFKGATTMAILNALANKDPAPPHTIAPTPRPLSIFIMRLLVKCPDDRPQTARDVIDELGAIERELAKFATPEAARLTQGGGRSGVVSAATVSLAGGGRRTAAPDTEEMPARRASYRTLVLLAAGLLCAGALAAGVYYLVRDREPAVVVRRPEPTPRPKEKGAPSPEASKPTPSGPEPGPLGMKFVRIPAGVFWMSRDRVNAQREEAIKADFYMAQHAVTQAQWQSVMGNNPSAYSREGTGRGIVEAVRDAELSQFPVESVSWHDVQDFLKKLNEQEKNSGWRYRLPTEAEWEYACRGGATTKEDCSFDFYLDRSSNELDSSQANIRGDLGVKDGPSLRRPCKVGSYPPNRLGLYDMHGNIWQWCEDLYAPKALGPPGLERTFRGGCWNNAADDCRAANRRGGSPDSASTLIGFRLVRVPTAEGKGGKGAVPRKG
ncbi:MAG: bifunctional serine/threonine-protein kinase/formylglycine-generating enzyme family protein [Gemmataceae bacterium]